MTETHTQFKFLGLISVVFIGVAIGLILTQMERRSSWSLSQHAASDRRIFVLYEVFLSVGIALLYLFLVKWFAPRFDLPSSFTYILTGIVAAQLIANWLPDKNDRSFSTRWHRILWYGSSGLLSLLLLYITASASFTTYSRIFACLSVITSLVFLGLFLFVKKVHTHFLWYQITFFLLFLSAILSAAYLN